MHLIPHLNFNGQCEAAFKFYEAVLGAKITFKISYGESPGGEQMPAELRGLVMHATIDINGQTVMGADSPPDRYEKPQGFAIAINLKDPAEGERIFNALADQGIVQMPFQATFWSPGFGMCADRFGVPWMVNCEAASAGEGN